jgi:hypothetical protein
VHELIWYLFMTSTNRCPLRMIANNPLDPNRPILSARQKIPSSQKDPRVRYPRVVAQAWSWSQTVKLSTVAFKRLILFVHQERWHWTNVPMLLAMAGQHQAF